MWLVSVAVVSQITGLLVVLLTTVAFCGKKAKPPQKPSKKDTDKTASVKEDEGATVYENFEPTTGNGPKQEDSKPVEPKSSEPTKKSTEVSKKSTEVAKRLKEPKCSVEKDSPGHKTSVSSQESQEKKAPSSDRPPSQYLL